MIFKALVIWMLIAAAEVLHGVLRVSLLNRRLGAHHSRQIGVFTGSVIILIISWLTVPWLGASTNGQLFGIGCLWLVLMLAFEIAFGRLVFRASWKRLASDFDFRKGGLLSIGMLILFAAPFLATKLRSLF